MTDAAPEVLTLADAARRAGRDPRTLRRWLNEGRLPGAQRTTDGATDVWAIPAAEVDAVVHELADRATPPAELAPTADLVAMTAERERRAAAEVDAARLAAELAAATAERERLAVELAAATEALARERDARMRAGDEATAERERRAAAERERDAEADRRTAAEALAAEGRQDASEARARADVLAAEVLTLSTEAAELRTQRRWRYRRRNA